MKTIKKISILFLLIFIISSCKTNLENETILRTVCNPMNLSYRFALEEPTWREAADPSVIVFKDEYYLFASKSSGYWCSKDLYNWDFIENYEIPTEEYAPTAIVLEDTVYFLASSLTKSTIYKSGDPKSGKWEIALDSLEIPVWDPAFYQDDDGKLYLYWGCSNVTPIYGVELDFRNDFKFKGEPVSVIYSNPENHGWERRGDFNNDTTLRPWVEGPWMTKYEGKYYLQYAAPGTEYIIYADGVYISDNPLGPYTYAKHNPFSLKPDGFATGAGHGGTFQDKYGNYWHIGTVCISVKHMTERRLCLYPTFIDKDGVFYSNSGYGDYPYIIPSKKITSREDIFPGWMLLSYKKPVETSSYIDSYRPDNATDENIKTFWAAKTGNENEWLSVDLEDEKEIYAIQVNYAEHLAKLHDRDSSIYYQYKIVYSNDKKDWKTLIDKTENKTDFTHDYIQMDKPVNGRYIKIINHYVPDGNFAITDLRVFGKGNGEIPESVKSLTLKRGPEDLTNVCISWNKVNNALGYTIKYGISKDKLYHNYLVYNDTTLMLRSLNVGVEYYFSIETFNENGITKSEIIKHLK